MGAKLCLQTGRRSNGGHVERKKECIGFFVEEMGEDVGPEEGSFCPPGGAFSLRERERQKCDNIVEVATNTKQKL